MKKTSSRLLTLTMFVAFLFASGVLTSRITNVTASPGQDCPTNCATKRDNTLASCENLSGDRKTRCQTSANAQYDKCIEACNGGNSGRGSDGGKTP